MNDRAIVLGIEEWFREHARALPWREVGADGRRDPYRAFVAEVMLQQTQVSRVLEKFGPFVARFPDMHTLARADEQDVLALWSGLGYYSRAKRLHAAARVLVEQHGGVVPADAESLRSLPGIGRYSAGSIASIVFGAPEAIVDGNVQRVLTRLYGEELRLGDAKTERWAWAHAERLVEASNDPAAFNEGLMELGATVCVPKGVRCVSCPVRDVCLAFATGRQEELPLPKARAKRREVFHSIVLLRDGDRIALVRRPDRGLWAGLWGPPGVERDDRAARAGELKGVVGVEVGALELGFTFETTHRIVRFGVHRAEGKAGSGEDFRWVTHDEAMALALSNAHRRLVVLAFEDEAGKPRNRRDFAQNEG